MEDPCPTCALTKIFDPLVLQLIRGYIPTPFEEARLARVKAAYEYQQQRLLQRMHAIEERIHRVQTTHTSAHAARKTEGLQWNIRGILLQLRVLSILKVEKVELLIFRHPIIDCFDPYEQPRSTTSRSPAPFSTSSIGRIRRKHLRDWLREQQWTTWSLLT